MRINFIGKAAIISALVATLSGCGVGPRPDVNLLLTTKNQEAWSEMIASTGHTLVVSSGGGSTSVAIAVSRELNASSKKLVIVDRCISNCAELLLPAAKSVALVDGPIIGFHGNILSYSNYVKVLEPKAHARCNWQYETEFSDFYKKQGVNPKFWELQMKHLNPNPTTGTMSATNCPSLDYNFEYYMWLPTSSQLRDGLRLDFQGNTCADDFESCVIKLKKLWRSGTKVMVGTTPVVI